MANPDRGFNTIGMPYYREQLLSSWPNHMVFDVGAPAAKIDPHILSTFKAGEWGHWGGFGRTPRTVRRNQVENTRIAEKAAATLQAPKFLSEKARESANDVEPAMERRISDVANALGAAELADLKAEVPGIYRNVEIKYSKFGVDDFDFGLVFPGSSLIALLTIEKILQQNSVLWTRDTHFKLLCEFAVTIDALYATHSKPGFTACCYCLYQRFVPLVRIRILIRYVGESGRLNLSSYKFAQDT